PPRARRRSLCAPSCGSLPRHPCRRRRRALAEDEYVFMDDERGALASRDSLPRLGELEERWVRDQLAIADAGEQRDDVLPVLESGFAAEGDRFACEITQAAALAQILRDCDEEAARLEHGGTGGVDASHRFAIVVTPGVSEVRAIGAVVARVGRAEVLSLPP